MSILCNYVDCGMQYKRDPRTAFLQPHYINDSQKGKEKKIHLGMYICIFQLDL